MGDDGDRHPPGRVMGHIRVKIGGLVDGLDGDPVGRQQHHPFGPFGETVLTCGKGGPARGREHRRRARAPARPHGPARALGRRPERGPGARRALP
ncbi:hypothetical protein MTP02_34170 [Streptomyces albus]|nr:hypothetical protein MTP02_34170 [Streptomyces albus]